MSQQDSSLVITPEQQLNQIRVQRALNRRRFLSGLGAGCAAIAGTAMLTGCGTAGSFASAATNESDVLNFALNLEYLEATFYSYIATGADISSSLTGGGPAPTGAPSAQPSFATSQIQDLFKEIYFDEISHVADLRAAIGSGAVARPQLNLAALGTVSTSNYITLSRLFEDVGVTAYAGAATLLDGNNLQAAAQILAVEAFHAGAIRLIAIQQGQTGYNTAAAKPADGYDVLPLDPGSSASNGPTASGGFFATAGASGSTTASQTSTFPGFAYRRTTSQVLSIVYAASSGSGGGFFPNGMNGNIKSI